MQTQTMTRGGQPAQQPTGTPNTRPGPAEPSPHMFCLRLVRVNGQLADLSPS